ncbi:hypothetical protein ACOMHN_039462 [Nucella lapillus]
MWHGRDRGLHENSLAGPVKRQQDIKGSLALLLPIWSKGRHMAWQMRVTRFHGTWSPERQGQAWRQDNMMMRRHWGRSGSHRHLSFPFNQANLHGSYRPVSSVPGPPVGLPAA